MTEKELLKIKKSLKKRAKKLHLGKKRSGAYVFGTLRKIQGNPVRTKTWKLGEYGGNIKALVNDSRTAVQIVHSDKPLKVGAYGRLFRWPLDKFELEMHLNDLTTSYYASKVIEWVESVTKEKGDLREPMGIIRGKNVIRRNPNPSEEYIPVKPRRLFIVQTLDDLEKLRALVNQGERIESVEGVGSFNGKPRSYHVRLLKLEPYEKEVWGESFYDYAARAFPAIVKNPPALFQKGGFAIVVENYRTKSLDIVKTFDLRNPDAPMMFDSKKDAEGYAKRSLEGLQWRVIPVTNVLRNPPLSSHGSSMKTKRTHGLNLPQMRALYKLVKQGNDMAIAYARKKLEVPRSESKVQLLAVVDHHIRDLAGR